MCLTLICVLKSLFCQKCVHQIQLWWDQCGRWFVGCVASFQTVWSSVAGGVAGGSSWSPEKLSEEAGAALPSSPPARAEYSTYSLSSARLYSWSYSKYLTKVLPLNCLLPVGSSRNIIWPLFIKAWSAKKSWDRDCVHWQNPGVKNRAENNLIPAGLLCI